MHYESATDAEALDAFQDLCRLEGIIPRSRRRTRSPGCGGSKGRWTADAPVLVCLSGRGDKDVAHVAALLGGTGVTAGQHADVLPAPRSPS